MNRSGILPSEVRGTLSDCIQFLEISLSHHNATEMAFREIEDYITETFGPQEVHHSPEIAQMHDEVYRRRKISAKARERLNDALNSLRCPEEE